MCIRCTKLLDIGCDTKTCETCIEYIDTHPWFVRDVVALTLVPIVKDIIVVIDVELLYLLLLVNILIL